MTLRPLFRNAAAAVAVLTLSAGLAACGSGSSSSGSGGGDSSGASPSAGAQPTTATATVAGSSAKGPTLVVGDQAGAGSQALLTAAGLIHSFSFPVKFADFTSGPPTLQAMSAGSVDVALVGDTPPVFAAAGGAKIAVVGAYHNSPRFSALLVPKDSSIRSINDLKGKKIAVTEGSSSNYHLLDLLTKSGLSVHDVTIDNLQPAAALAAFSSGAIDAWDVWTPYVEQAEAQDHARVLVGGAHYGSNYSYSVASTAAIDDAKKSQEIAEFIKVIDRAHVWANTHPAAWAAIWAKATGLPQSVMLKAAKDAISRPVPVTPQLQAEEQSLVKAFAGTGLIPHSYDFGHYITSKYNSSIH